MLHTTFADSVLARRPVGASLCGEPCLDAENGTMFAQRLTSTFRNHSHINNVLTHIASGRWDRIEDALATLLTSSTEVAPSSPLARNVLDLLWAEGGITGRIMKPLFLDACRASLSPPLAERCAGGIATLASLTLSNFENGHRTATRSPPQPSNAGSPTGFKSDT